MTAEVPFHLPDPMGSSKRLLEPVDRISEVLFGLIMALTFTCASSVAHADREEVREMLIGALGCNLAWGVVDGCHDHRPRRLSLL